MAFQVAVFTILGLAFVSQVAVAQTVADIVTPDFFKGIIDQAAADCAGKSFYSRQAFLDALGSYTDFAATGSADDNKREIAAFFAHVTYLTGHFCDIEARVPRNNKSYCDRAESTEYPCNPDKKYYSRGPLQLTWNYNYGAAGKAIGFDGLNSPETVASDPVVAFKTGLWFWMTYVHSVMGQGFVATFPPLYGADVESDGKSPAISYYTDYCTQLNVAPGSWCSGLHF